MTATATVVGLDEAFAELYNPTGLPWEEHTAVPNLADFECGECWQIGPHTETCSKHPNNYVIQLLEGDSMDCKTEGCENEALAAKGPYALLCDEHKQAKQAAGTIGRKPKKAAKAKVVRIPKKAAVNRYVAPVAPAAAEPGLFPDLLARVRETAGGEPEGGPLDAIVNDVVSQTTEVIEAAVLAAAKQIAELLRARIADSLR